MGQKVHPYGFRLGIIRDWQSRWYAARREYREFAVEDDKIRKYLRKRLPGIIMGAAQRVRGRSVEAGVSTIEIERMANIIKVTLHTARPGMIIGRGGRGIDELRAELEKVVEPRRVQLNVLEIKQPELDALLVAESIAGQIARRVSFKRAVRMAIARTMQRGGKGIKVLVSGRLGGAEIARKYGDKNGKVPLHTLRADVDYGVTEAKTTYGNIGIKVWIYRGEVLPRPTQGPIQRQPSKAGATAESDDSAQKGWRRVPREEAVAEPDPVIAARAEDAPDAEGRPVVAEPGPEVALADVALEAAQTPASDPEAAVDGDSAEA